MNSERRLFIGLMAVLVLVAIFVVLIHPGPPPARLSVNSGDEDGAQQLSRWLETQDYTVRQLRSQPLPLDEVDVLFILYPQMPYSRAEINTIRSWVARGHRLIVAGEPYVMNDLLAMYNVSLVDLEEPAVQPVVSAPVLLNPPMGEVPLAALHGIVTRREDVIVPLWDHDLPVLLSLQHGDGIVWVVGGYQPFTNAGLTDQRSTDFIRNLLVGVPRGSVIGFDESRHIPETVTGSLSGWLLGTAPGWGVILAGAITLLFLGLRGRRFGRTVPITQERLRREPVEYIQAMANLLRRSGQREEILRHYDQHLRRRFSERYAVDPKLAPNELVQALVFCDSSLDEAALRNLLERLSRKQVSEQELVTIIAEVDDWLRKIP